jgi:hypothetical protein
MANPQLLSGARGVIKNGESVLAFATDITVNVRHNVRPTYVMGRMNAGAIDSLSYDVDVSVGRVIPVNAKDADYDPANTPNTEVRESSISAISVGLEAIIAQMVASGDLNIVLTDRATGATISSVKGCRFTGRSMSMNANDVASERLTFQGIYDAGYTGTGGGQPENSATDGYGV